MFFMIIKIWMFPSSLCSNLTDATVAVADNRVTPGDVLIDVCSVREVQALQVQRSPLWRPLLAAPVRLLHLQDAVEHDPAEPQWPTGWGQHAKRDYFVLLSSPSHLCSDTHWPWHTGISATLLQLPMVTFMLVSFGEHLRLPGGRQKCDTGVLPCSINDGETTCDRHRFRFDLHVKQQCWVSHILSSWCHKNRQSVGPQVLCSCSSCSRSVQYLLTVFCGTDLSDHLNTFLGAAEWHARVLRSPPPVSHLHTEINEHTAQYSA